MTSLSSAGTPLPGGSVVATTRAGSIHMLVCVKPTTKNFTAEILAFELKAGVMTGLMELLVERIRAVVGCRDWQGMIIS